MQDITFEHLMDKLALTILRRKLLRISLKDAKGERLRILTCALTDIERQHDVINIELNRRAGIIP